MHLVIDAIDNIHQTNFHHDIEFITYFTIRQVAIKLYHIIKHDKSNLSHITTHHIMIGITGTPGVGKHTITDIISKQLDYSILNLTKLALHSDLDVNNIDTNLLGVMVEKRATHNMILVGHLVPYVISNVNISHIIILRRSPYHLRDIYQERGYTEEKSLANLGSEILGTITSDVMQISREKAFQVDTTSITAEDTAGIIIDIMNGKKIPCDVDWLEMIKQKGDLQEFFKY